MIETIFGDQHWLAHINLYSSIKAINDIIDVLDMFQMSKKTWHHDSNPEGFTITDATSGKLITKMRNDFIEIIGLVSIK